MFLVDCKDSRTTSVKAESTLIESLAAHSTICMMFVMLGGIEVDSLQIVRRSNGILPVVDPPGVSSTPLGDW